ncbi:amidohydrolase family protein [Nitratireductor sp. XY-223]|uniref:amidohydrolase family protein n=1 Tax=Nitratireductor sp. XY-223 TaxID=2561926 RepID=UPI001FEF3DFD|nr:amidohydrolase family protein [Nitratireductor sp. XY-223]
MNTSVKTTDRRATGFGTTMRGVLVGGASKPVDILIEGARIKAIEPSPQSGGGVVLPLMSDIHVHLDKTYTVDRTGSGAASLFDAIDRMDADKALWTPQDIRARAARALEKAYAHGVSVMRSHVDWTEPDVPMAWSVLNELAQEWRGRIHLQVVALCPLDLIAEAGEPIAARAGADGGVLGAFVYRNDNLAEKMRRVFLLADRNDLELDFHVDEGLEYEARGFEAIVAEAEKRGGGRQVLCGHVCSLALRAPEDIARLVARAAAAKIGLVSLPTTNSYLQDRNSGRTPRFRGLAPIKEARAAGMDVFLASDNVADVFYPYGDYDPFDVLRAGVMAAQLEPGDWLDAISGSAARWCGAEAGDLAVGAKADFLRFDATDLRDLVSRLGAPREVWRDGRTDLERTNP